MRSTPFVNGWRRLRAAIVSPPAKDLLALAVGASLALAFAPFALWPVAVLAPAVLFRLWSDCGRGRAAWRGWLFGVGMWGAGVYWIYYSLHLFGSAIAPLAGALTALFVFALGLLTAVLGALIGGRAFADRGAVWFLLVLPGAWVLLEWVRSWLLTGFPWLLLGTSQVDTWLAGYAPVIGVYGVSLLVTVCAGALALIWRASMRQRLFAVALVAVIWAGGAALTNVVWTRPAGLPFDVALVQGNIAQAKKFKTVKLALRRYERLTRKVAGEAELVIWPETAVPTFYRRVADRLNELARDMKAKGTYVVTGVFVWSDDGTRYYNAVRPLGPARRAYKKQKLVPFGEYMPLRDLLGFLEEYIRIPMSDITPGPRGQPPLKVGPWRLGASVCYEVAYPGVMRRRAARSTVLVNVSNDAWFGDSTAPHQHLQIARMRALETGRPLLRATNTGISAIIDHNGNIIARGPQFEVAVIRGRVMPRTGLTPYVRFGDAPMIVLTFLLALGPWLVNAWRRRRRRPTPPA